MLWLLALGVVALAAANSDSISTSPTSRRRGGSTLPLKRDDNERWMCAERDADSHADLLALGYRLKLQESRVPWWTRRRLLKQHAARLESSRPGWEEFFYDSRDSTTTLRYDGDITRMVRPPQYTIEPRPPTALVEQVLTHENRARVEQRLARMAADRRRAVSASTPDRAQALARVDAWEKNLRDAHVRVDVYIREALEAKAVHAALVRQVSPVDALQFVHSQLEQHREAWLAYFVSHPGAAFDTKPGQLGHAVDWPLKPPSPKPRTRSRPAAPRPIAALDFDRFDSEAVVEAPASTLPPGWEGIWSDFDTGVIGESAFRALARDRVEGMLRDLGNQLPADSLQREVVLEQRREELHDITEDMIRLFWKQRLREDG